MAVRRRREVTVSATTAAAVVGVRLGFAALAIACGATDDEVPAVEGYLDGRDYPDSVTDAIADMREAIAHVRRTS